MTRQWLVTKRDLVCLGCYAPAERKQVKITDRKITFTCAYCGGAVEREATNYYDYRACTKCKFTRRVTVKIFQRSEYCRDTCAVCDALAAAVKHERAAKRMRDKAAKLAVNRGGRKK